MLALVVFSANAYAFNPSVDVGFPVNPGNCNDLNPFTSSSFTWVADITNHGPGSVRIWPQGFHSPKAGCGATGDNYDSNLFRMSGRINYPAGANDQTTFDYYTNSFNCGRVQLDGVFKDDQGNLKTFMGIVINYGVDCPSAPTPQTPVIDYVTPTTVNNCNSVLDIYGRFLTNVVQFFDANGNKYTVTGMVDSSNTHTSVSIPTNLPLGQTRVRIYAAADRISNEKIITVQSCGTPNLNPAGFVDAVNCDIIGGWAADLNARSQPITVSVYDGAVNGGTLLVSALTTGYRPDVNAAYDLTGNHGFTFTTPNSIKDNTRHEIFVYGTDTSNRRFSLGGSPASLTCQGSPSNNPPTISSCSTPPGNAIVGVGTVINYAISDPDGDSFTVLVTWGDGKTSAGGQSSATHTYTSIGTYSVSITTTDSKGASSSRNCGTITVIATPNNPPTISSCTPPVSATVGTIATLTYTITDPDGDSFTVLVNWGDGTTSSGGQSSASHVYSSTGTFSISITATDSRSGSTTRNCGSIIITPVGGNNPPTISSCTSPVSATVGTIATLTYTISDPEGNSFTTSINWGDGTTSSGGQSSASHVYSSTGTFSISITATDSLGASSSRNCGSIIIIPGGNNPPTINSCPSLVTVNLGQIATILYSITDPEGDDFTVSIDWGDTKTTTEGKTSASHLYAAPGTYTVKITATDTKNAVSSKTCANVITVTPGGNNPPTISSCTSPVSATVGTIATLTYTITDPDGDSFTVLVNWGDGTTSAGSASSASHIYTSTGTFSISITATDSRSGSTTRNCGSIIITPVGGNNPPTISSCTNSGTATIGTSSSVSYSVTDPEGNSFTTSINWGDGTSTSGGLSSATHTYTSTGTYSLTITATDSLGASSSRSCNSLTISTGGGSGGSGGTSCQTSKLQITKVSAKVDSKSDNSIRDGDEISRKAKPGSDFELEIEVENQYNSSGPDIEDITITATLEELDDGDDFEEESREFDLNPGDDKKITFKFDVPENAEEDSYSISIEAEGEDEDSNRQSCDFDTELEVEKDEHDLSISSLSVKPNLGNCTETATAQIKIVNSGQEDETASIEISGQSGYMQRFDGIFIDSDIGLKIYSSNLNLKFQEALDEGSNLLVFNVYGTNNKLLDSKTVEVIAGHCLKEGQLNIKTQVLAGTVQKVQGKKSTIVLNPSQISVNSWELFFGSNYASLKKIIFYALMFFFILSMIIILLMGIRLETE